MLVPAHSLESRRATAIPALSLTTYAVGQTITGSARAGGVTSQWKRDGVDIAGETAADYTLTNADRAKTITRVDTGPGGPATSHAIVFKAEGIGWGLAFHHCADATYSGGYMVDWIARKDPKGVVPTFLPTGGDSTKPRAPVFTTPSGLQGAYFKAQLQTASPIAWRHGGYLEIAKTISAALLQELTIHIDWYPESGAPAGYVERQEGPGFNARGGSAEPTALLGSPGTGKTKISFYDGTAWHEGAHAVETRYVSLTAVCKSNGDVLIYFNGDLVDTIASGWSPNAYGAINVFLGSAWHSGTTSMSAPMEGHVFMVGLHDAALSAAQVAGLHDIAFAELGLDLSVDWWPNDDAAVVEFLDLAGKKHVEDTGDSSFERILEWQGSDSGARVHTTTSEARAPKRGNATADRLNYRETAVFTGGASGSETYITCGDLAHIFDVNKRFIAHAHLFIPTGAITVDTSSHRAGWLGNILYENSTGVQCVSFVKDTANEYGFGANAFVCRFMIYSTTERTIAVRVYENTPFVLEHGVDASDNLFLRACDVNGKRSAVQAARGTYTPGGNLFIGGNGYSGSTSLAFKLARKVIRAGYDATYLSLARPWSTRETAIDCAP